MHTSLRPNTSFPISDHRVTLASTILRMFAVATGLLSRWGSSLFCMKIVEMCIDIERRSPIYCLNMLYQIPKITRFKNLASISRFFLTQL